MILEVFLGYQKKQNVVLPKIGIDFKIKYIFKLKVYNEIF